MAVKIKKYVNRKLYDEEASAYLSMLELSDLVAKNPDVQVICDRTGRDITLETLSRALNERLKAHADEDSSVETSLNYSPPFPVADLARLIAKVPSKTALSKTALSKTTLSKAASSKTTPSKTVLSKTVLSKTVLSKTVPSKMVLSKIVPSKMVLSKKNSCGGKS